MTRMHRPVWAFVIVNPRRTGFLASRPIYIKIPKYNSKVPWWETFCFTQWRNTQLHVQCSSFIGVIWSCYPNRLPRDYLVRVTLLVPFVNTRLGQAHINPHLTRLVQLFKENAGVTNEFLILFSKVLPRRTCFVVGMIFKLTLVWFSSKISMLSIRIQCTVPSKNMQTSVLCPLHTFYVFILGIHLSKQVTFT